MQVEMQMNRLYETAAGGLVYPIEPVLVDGCPGFFCEVFISAGSELRRNVGIHYHSDGRVMWEPDDTFDGKADELKVVRPYDSQNPWFE